MLRLGILGKLMWIRVAIMAILSLRSADDDTRFSFHSHVERMGRRSAALSIFSCSRVVLGMRCALPVFHVPGFEWWKIVLLTIGTFLDSYGWLDCPRNSSSRIFCSDCSRAVFTVKCWA